MFQFLYLFTYFHFFLQDISPFSNNSDSHTLSQDDISTRFNLEIVKNISYQCK